MGRGELSVLLWCVRVAESNPAQHCVSLRGAACASCEAPREHLPCLSNGAAKTRFAPGRTRARLFKPNVKTDPPHAFLFL